MVAPRRAAVLVVVVAAALGLSRGPAAPTAAQPPPARVHAAAPDAAPAALAHRVGGAPGAVAAHGHWAWVGSGAQVVTLDLAAPAGPRVLDRTALDAVVGDVSVRADGTRLAAVAGGEVVVWRVDGAGRATVQGALDVSPQPQSYGGAPAIVSRDAGRRLAWHGDRLVVAMVDDGVAAVVLRLAVADVDGGAPRWLATAERTLAEGPFAGGELHALAATTGHAVVARAVTTPGGAAMAVSVFTLPAGAVPQHHGDWAADGRIVDLADLGGDRVALLGERRVPDMATVEPYVAVVDAAAVAARGSAALPAPPVFSAPHRLAAGRDGRLYATLSGAQPQLVAVDVDADSRPAAASAWPRPTTAVAVAAVDGGLLWRDGGGVTRLALGGGAAPVAGPALPLTPSASDVALVDGRLFAAAPDSPWPLVGGPADAPADLAPLTDAAGRLPVADAAARTLYDAMPQALAADGDRLWLLDGVSSRALWQVERADPTAPRLRWRGDTRAHAMAAVGDGVWLADDRGLVALADRGGEALAEVDRHALGDQRTVVALARRPGGVVALVRVLGALSTLVVFDAGADGAIVERGNVVLPAATRPLLAPGVDVSGTRAYVAWERLTIVDLTDPDRPVLAGGLVDGAADGTAGPAAPVFVDVAVDADAGRAVAAAGPDGTAVLDVRDPRAIRVLQWLATPGSARRVAMDGDRVAVAEMAGGVSIVAMTDASGARRAYLPLVMR